MPAKPKDEAVTPAAIEFVLSKPIQAHGEEVKTLRMREPGVGDLIEIGAFPATIDMSSDDYDVRQNPRAMAALISRLAAIPPSSVVMMTTKDFTGVCVVLSPFFIPASGAG